MKKLFVALLLLVVTTGAFAQGTLTSSLTGVVTTDGNPIPGVTVTVTSPNLQGTRTTTTGEGGGYSFAALPPGTYSVKFELEGMQTVNQTVTLAVATVGRADADLKMSTVAEAITVTASAPSVLETPSVAANYEYNTVDELPINRNPLAIAALAPGVLGDTTAGNNSLNTFSANQLVISGSPGYDNLIMVNGVTITENIRSQAGPLFIEDAVQETTVITGAISAEFGRFTGGVVNSITKSGGNEFSGSFRDSIDNPDWTRKTDFPGQADPADNINETYEATLGGYILRDRLWFFGAGRYRDRVESFSTILPTGNIGGVPAAQGSATLPYDRSDEETRYEVKFTGAVTPKHSVVASYLKKDRSLVNNRFTTNIYDLASLSPQDTPEDLLSAHYNGVITNSLLVEAQYSRRQLAFENSGSRFTDLIQGTLMINVGVTPNARFNSPTFCACNTDERNNESFLLKGSYFLSTRSFGNHNFVIGAEDFHESRAAENHQSGSDFRILVPAVRIINGEIFPTIDSSSLSRIRWTPIFAGANETDLQTQSVFINDKWDLNNHWSFNLGVRYDKNHSEDGIGNVSSDDQAISPRLTAIFDPIGNSKHRFTASYNQYVSRIVEGISSNADISGQPATIDMQYRGPVINPTNAPPTLNSAQALAAMFEWFQANGGTGAVRDLLHPNGALSVPGFDYVFDSTLKSPNVDEFTLGYGVQLGRNAYAKFDAIYRDWNDFYARRIDTSTGRRTDQFGLPHDTAVIYNDNDIQREYRGLQMQGNWRPNRLNLGVSYTYSELEGNDEGENAGSGPILNNPLASYYPELAGYENRLPIGRIDFFDLRHKGKVWASYDFDFGALGRVVPSVLHSYHSGIPYSAIGTITMPAPGAPAGLPYARSLLGAQNYYFSDRGAFETDNIHQTDLSLNYGLRLWQVEFFAQADMLNVFDNDGVEDWNFVNRTVRTQSSALCLQGANGPTPGARCLSFNPFTETPVEGIHYQKDVAFGQPNNFQAFQLPRTYRFSLGVRF
jgi:hypothetical protein